MKNNKRVADVIGAEDIKSWKNGKAVLIDAPTGAGKSYFIQNNLYKYAVENNKKILFLSNRNILKEQFSNDITYHDDRVIKVINYQGLESMCIKKDVDVDVDKYDYIVADECHYFFTDAQFNNKTDLMLEKLKDLSNSVLILMSATPNLTKRYFKDIIEYTYAKKQDYSYIDNLYFYDSNDAIERMLLDLPKDEKAIYFTGAKKAYDTSKKLGNSSFICSEYNETHKIHSNLEEKQNIITHNKFNSRVLCCTTVLDNGVNIVDPDVKTVVIDVFDISTLQQCLGRKRITNANDKITLYIKNWNNNRVGGIQTKTRDLTEKATFLIKNGEVEFLNIYKKNTYSQIIDIILVDGRAKLKVNSAMFIKHLDTSLFCIKILNHGKSGYKNIILKKLGINKKIVKNLDDYYNAITISDTLESMLGERLYKEQQNALIETIDFRVDGRQQRGYRKLNYALDEVLGLPYVILPRKFQNKRHWTIEKIVK